MGVVCQNSADRDPKGNRRLAPQPESPRSAELSPFALDHGRTDWLCRRGLEAGVACQDFPARRNEFPVPDHRESVAEAAERLGNFGSASSRGVRHRRISLQFPCRSGNSPQRRVRPGLHPPPSSPRLRRIRARSAIRRRISRHSAGFLGECLGGRRCYRAAGIDWSKRTLKNRRKSLQQR